MFYVLFSLCFQVKAKLSVPPGTSADVFSDADKKLVAPVVENFAKKLAQVPTVDVSKLEKKSPLPVPKGPHIVYEVTSADGFFCRSHDINEVIIYRQPLKWKLCNSIGLFVQVIPLVGGGD